MSSSSKRVGGAGKATARSAKPRPTRVAAKSPTTSPKRAVASPKGGRQAKALIALRKEAVLPRRARRAKSSQGRTAADLLKENAPSPTVAPEPEPELATTAIENPRVVTVTAATTEGPLALLEDASVVALEEVAIVAAELPVIAAELPVVSAELPVIAAELPVIAAELPVIAAELPVIAAELPVVAAELPVVSAELPVIAAEPLVIAAELPVVSAELPVVAEEPLVIAAEPLVIAAELLVVSAEPLPEPSIPPGVADEETAPGAIATLADAITGPPTLEEVAFTGEIAEELELVQDAFVETSADSETVLFGEDAPMPELSALAGLALAPAAATAERPPAEPAEARPPEDGPAPEKVARLARPGWLLAKVKWWTRRRS
jgi:hypothetical protein